jgi:hypothetical protein
MMLVVDARAEQPPVLPFHRVSTAPPGALEIQPAAGREDVLAAIDDDVPTIGVVTTSHDGSEIDWGTATLPGAPPAVRALHELPWFQAQAETGAVRYVPDLDAAIGDLRTGDARAAYLLPATGAERIRRVVEARERMPQKSTFFWPKPRTGIVLRALDLDGPEAPPG